MRTLHSVLARTNHAEVRARERLGIKMDYGDIRAIETLLSKFFGGDSAANEAVRVIKEYPEEGGATLLAVLHDNLWVPVIYLRKSGQVVTIYPSKRLPKELRKANTRVRRERAQSR